MRCLSGGVCQRESVGMAGLGGLVGGLRLLIDSDRLTSLHA